MADTLKVLGQSNPAATTPTTLYTVPAATSTSISSITICNRSAASASFRISVAVSGAPDSAQQYIYYDQDLTANATYVATIGMSLATGDVVRVYASSGNLSFNAFGVEVTA